MRVGGRDSKMKRLALMSTDSQVFVRVRVCVCVCVCTHRVLEYRDYASIIATFLTSHQLNPHPRSGCQNTKYQILYGPCDVSRHRLSSLSPLSSPIPSYLIQSCLHLPHISSPHPPLLVTNAITISGDGTPISGKTNRIPVRSDSTRRLWANYSNLVRE
jgi:hypothetical protein